MKIDLSYAELHNPLFLGGTNWGQKLQPKMSKGSLLLAYDRTEKELLVSSGKFIAIIPTSNVASMTPMPEGLSAQAETVTEAVNPLVNPPKRGRVTAQVSGPHDHVFAGTGAGKTNDKR